MHIIVRSINRDSSPKTLVSVKKLVQKGKVTSSPDFRCFKRRGSHVIHADLSRILLVTSKPPGTAPLTRMPPVYITTAVT
ncbi:uncharacterized protein EDB91DRAFT_1167885 [Suillus paluster]|uniref:uncharacterized protein n=1 Tax=Suillus paluster TaxID=48578 RepID=UPI001B8723B1|nr:uncharacterized protein EDB91DRAFT_1167885 [Suillus paluster]KAG1725638.1 hypothetical protein EDB91DRAFT_1167885 [Suillus paluster]